MSLTTPDFPQLVDDMNQEEALGPMYWLPVDQDVNPTQDLIERGDDFPPSTRRMLEEMGVMCPMARRFGVHPRL